VNPRRSAADRRQASPSNCDGDGFGIRRWHVRGRIHNVKFFTKCQPETANAAIGTKRSVTMGKMPSRGALIIAPVRPMAQYRSRVGAARLTLV
jgi:hypothetical protein